MRVLLYGCGDFSHVLEYLAHATTQLGLPAFAPFDPNNTHAHIPVDLIATELRTLPELTKQYGDGVAANIAALTAQGVNVVLGVDATHHKSFGLFDLIIFRNPHSGTYGNSQDSGGSSYLESSTDNQILLKGVLGNTTITREPYGLVLITVVGWPYVGMNPKGVTGIKGMQLEVPDFAAAYGAPAGLQFLGHLNFGTQWVARNTGATFAAEELGIVYRDDTCWRNAELVERILRASSPADVPAWTNLHPDIEKIKAKIASDH